MKTGKKIIILLAIVFIFLPVFVQAAPSWWPIVPCGLNSQPKDSSGVELPKTAPDGHDYTQPCNRCDLFKLFKNIIDFVLEGLMPPIAAILFVWGGFLILMGGANPGWISRGRTIFWNTFMGVVIISASWLITNTIIKSLAEESITNPNVPWYQFECRVTVRGDGGGELEKKYACQNNQCVENANGTFTEPTCNNSCGGTPPVQKYSCNSNNQCVVDPNGQYSTNNCDNECAPAPPVPPVPTDLTVTTASLSGATQNKPYSQTLTATGGVTPYAWSTSQGSLPAGLTLNSSSGVISGTPTTTGTFNFTVQAQDASSPKQTATKQLSIVVATQAASVAISNVVSGNITSTNAVITWTTDKPSTSQVEYGTTTGYGSNTPVVGSQVSNHSVTVSGLNPGTTYNYRAVSSITGFTARSANYTFRTTGAATSALSVTTASLSGATQNKPYSQTLTATGGVTPYAWSTSQGSLPAGLTLNSSSGVISGTPTTTGTFNFTVQAQDASSPKQTATKQLSIVVATVVATNCGDFNLVCSNTARTCPSLAQDTGLPAGQSTWAYLIPSAAHAIPGVNTNKFLESIMRIETNGRLNKQSSSVPPSCGLMQIQAATANVLRSRCGINHAITCDWLRGQDLEQNETLETVAKASICIASEYAISIKNSSCYGGQIRDLAAGYNGGGGCNQNNKNDNALALSVSCSDKATAQPKYDKDCNNRPTVRYECLWDNLEHTTCNTGFNETRDYAAKFNACYF